MKNKSEDKLREIECPRCKGEKCILNTDNKGNDWRSPFECALCNGTGKVKK